jgi:hypothetical protein
MDRAESAKCDTHEYHTSSGRCRALLRRRHLKKLLEMCNQLLAESIGSTVFDLPDVPRDAACGWLSTRLLGPVTCSTINAHAMPLSHRVTTVVPVMVLRLRRRVQHPSGPHRRPGRSPGGAVRPMADLGEFSGCDTHLHYRGPAGRVGLHALPHRLLQNCRYALFGIYFIMLSSDDADVLVRKRYTRKASLCPLSEIRSHY